MATVNPTPEAQPADPEGQYHQYVTHHIPWYVHALWISFWVLCAWYHLRWLLPAFRSELVSPP